MKTYSQKIITDSRIVNIDIIKAIAAFLVCFYHFQLLDFGRFSQGVYTPNINKIITSICSASVPLFFLLSGLFALQIDKGYKYYLIKSFNCFKIYLIWGLLSGMIIELLHQKEITFSKIILYIDFLWFLEALAVLYIFSIIYHKVKSKKYINIILLVLLIYPFIINFIYDFIILFMPIWTPIHTGCFRLYSIVYFILPFYIKSPKNKIYNVVIILLGIILINFEVFVYSNYYSAIYDGVNSSFPTIGALLVTWGVYSLFINFKFNTNFTTKYISYLGCNCLGIYIFHLPLIFLYREFISTEKVSLLYAIIFTFIVISLSATIFYSLKKIPYIKWTLKL